MIKFKIDNQEFQLKDFISIGDYVKIYKIKDLFKEDYFAAKILNIITGAPLDLLKEAEYEKIGYLANYVLSLFPYDKPEFKQTFELNGVKYGFLPNWRDISFAEFVDLDTLSSKKENDLLDVLHVIAAIMYRPITTEISEHNYFIEEYNVETLYGRAELFKNQLDIKYVLSGQFFFVNYATKLSNYTLPYSTPKLTLMEQLKMIWMMWRLVFKITSKKRLGGFLSSTKLLTTILQNTTTYTRKN